MQMKDLEALEIPKESEPTIERPLSAEEKALKEVEKTMPAIVAPETALPAIRFALFNFFIANPDQTREGFNKDLDREISKLSALGAKEEKYKNNDKIPTVGTEVEFPIEWMDEALDPNILTKMGVKNEKEPTYDHLYEVNPSWSYSTAVQSRIIQELRNSKIIKDEENRSLSLHLSFGAPTFIKDKTNFFDPKNMADFFVNISTIAYSSERRINSRKSTGTFLLREHRLDKNDKTGSFRFEIKTLGFDDATAFRSIEEMQMLCSAYFANLKNNLTPQDCDKIDIKLASLWNLFVDNFENFIQNKNFDDVALNACANYGQSTKIVKNHPEIIPEARLIFATYAKEVKRILFPTLNPELEE